LASAAAARGWRRLDVPQLSNFEEVPEDQYYHRASRLGLVHSSRLPWILAWLVPSVADEFRFRDFGITSYPGWTDRQLMILAAFLTVISLGSMLTGLVLFEKRPPPLYWPRAATWGVAFLNALVLIGSSFWQHQWISLPVLFAGLVLWYLFLSDRMRFWSANGAKQPPDR